MSFFDGLERFAGEVEKFFKDKPEVLKLKSCKKCSYYRKGYCTQTSPPTKVLSEYYAHGCLYYTTEAPVIGKDVTELATKADVASMKADLAAMKATLASVGVMRTAQLIEKKGGGASLNTYSTDEEVTTSSETWVLKREFNISTPTPPAGVTVYKYALMVSIETKYSGNVTAHARIDVDDEILDDTLEAASTYSWRDRAKEVSIGSHNVKIYLKKSGACTASHLRGTRGTCGIGTVGTAETKVATIQTTGEGKGSLVVAGKGYEDPATVTGVMKADESEANKVEVEVEVTADGSIYSNFGCLDTVLLEILAIYTTTNNPDLPAFLEWIESTFLMAATSP